MIRMTLHIEDSENSQVQILDDGTTIADIMSALHWVKKEKTRQINKYQRYYKPIRDKKREEILQALPPPPAEDKPKRGRGRPRKYPADTPKF